MALPDYTTRGVAETRQTILNELAQGPGILVVEGPSGSGKTYLKQSLSRGLGKRFTLVDLPYSRLDPAQFHTALATQLSPGAPPGEAPVTRVQQQAARQAREGLPVLILIDDAQFMPADSMDRTSW